MSKPATIKEVNARVEQLAGEFQQGLKDLKSEFLVNYTNEGLEETTTHKKKVSDFILKFNKFETEINLSLSGIKEDIRHLNNKVEISDSNYKNMEIRGRYNYILVHGIKEDVGDIYENLLQLINLKLLNVSNDSEVCVKKRDINRCYRLGKKDPQKTRPVAVQFCTQWIRDVVFYKKKLLKGSKVVFMEFLTDENLKLLKMAKNIMGKAAWTFRGLVYAGNKENKVLLKREDDLKKLDGIMHLCAK